VLFFFSVWTFGEIIAVYSFFSHTCSWVVWKGRNNRIFTHTTQDLVNLLD